MTRWPSIFIYSLTVVLQSACVGAKNRGEDMLTVVVLSISKCDATPPTLALVRKAMDEVGLEGTIEHIVIHDAEEARKYRFAGSPTVRVNGLDIDPAMRSVANFGMT